MKKILSFALLGLALSANAQHLPNGNFTNWKTACGNSYQSSTPAGERQRPDKEPESWNGSSVNQQVMGIVKKETLVTQGSPDENSWTVLTNKFVGLGNFGSNAPAFINFGTPWVYAVSTISKCDGGVYGGMAFSNRPDAIKGRYKRTTGTKGEENAHIIAYLWKGTFTSKIAATGEVSKDDVDRVVMGKETGTTSGTLIASCDSSFSSTNNNWEEIIVPLNYVQGQEETLPEKMNVIISSADYWTRSNIKAGNVLEVDDVDFIYYHSISDVKYGETALNFTKTSAESASYEVYRCDMSTITYDAAQTITYTLKGVAATFDKIYNEQTGLLTITVKGDDYAVNSNSKTVYEVQFHAPDYTGLLSGLKVNGNVISTFNENNFFYTVVGDYTKGCIEATTKGADDNADVTYDGASRIASVMVKGGAKSKTYYVKFARKATEYTGKMIIAMDGMFLSASNSPVGISTPIDGKVDFQLLNFSLEGLGLIGDIFVTDVAYGEPVNGVVNFSQKQTINIFGAMGMLLGDLPVTLTGKVENGEMTAQINITWNDGDKDHPIIVNVYPFSTSSIDLQSASGAGKYISAVKEGLTNKNALIYVAGGETVSAENADNVVVGSTCDNFTLTEGQAFDAPKAFTATKVTYDRTLSAGKVQTFVLPFSFTPDEDDVVAALESVEGSVLTFKRIEDATEANKPYLIQTDNTNALTSFDNVNIEPTTGDLTTTVDGVSHIGSYAELTVTDAYGYAGGQFVKAGKGTVKPFRTYITIPTGSAAAPKAFDIHFADTETGIATVVTDSKDQNVYNLQGVRVAKSLNGLPKGIYIVNGKKTVIK